MIDYDVVVIGCGPAGATTARISAERGLQVLLVDKKQELGVPIQCSGAVSAYALESTNIIPNDEFVLTPIYGFATFDSKGDSTILDYRKLKPEQYKSQPLGYVVDRRRFDRYLTALAKQAGVEVWLKTEAIDYTTLKNNTVEVQLNRFGERLKIRTKVIVGADGLQSQVGKWANLQTRIKPDHLASCLQFVVDGIDTNGLLEIITGHEWAPGGYAWVFPKGHGYAEVGLAIIRTMTDKDACWHLNHFMKNSFMAKRFKHTRALEVQGGGVPFGAPLKKQIADNIILVGDAARQTNPITAGGIHTALFGGVIAGNFLGDFLPTNHPSTAQNLSQYQQRWLDEIGNDIWKLYKIKTKIKIDTLRAKDPSKQYQLYYKFLSCYFHPNSPFRRI